MVPRSITSMREEKTHRSCACHQETKDDDVSGLWSPPGSVCRDSGQQLNNTPMAQLLWGW